MKTKKKQIICILVLVLLVVVVFIVSIWPGIYDFLCKNRIYSDIEAELVSIDHSNIRIVAVSGNEDEGISYSAGASGVIFDYENGVYYALTAYHVINSTDSDRYIIATALTPAYDEYKKENGITGHIPPPEYYDLMPEANVEYKDEKNDLAIISFRYSEKLEEVEIASDNPKKGDRIVTIGNPVDIEGHYVHSYGKIVSSKEMTFEAGDGQLPNQVLKHSAYVSPGSSGGAVLSGQMQLVGINIGGGTDFLGRFRYGVMIPSSKIKKCIEDWYNH